MVPGLVGGTRLRAMTDSADLLATVRQLVADAGLYRPESALPGLVISAVGGDTVVLGWAESAPVPAVRTAVAIRTALLELLAAAGLNAIYERAPGASSGTITVTGPRASRQDSLCAVRRGAPPIGSESI